MSVWGEAFWLRVQFEKPLTALQIAQLRGMAADCGGLQEPQGKELNEFSFLDSEEGCKRIWWLLCCGAGRLDGNAAVTYYVVDA